MKRLVAIAVAAVIVVTAAWNSGGTKAQDGADATIQSLETEVALVRATSQARGKKINAQRTQIAELKALLPVINEDPAIGDVFAIQDFELTIQGTDLRQTVGSFDPQDANGVYLLVYLDVKNVTSSPKEFPFETFQVEDGQGRSYTFDSISAIYLLIEEFQRGTYDQLQPSIIYSTAVIFDVPEDATGFTLSTRRNEFEAPLDR